jgi:hypothetical protein
MHTILLAHDKSPCRALLYGMPKKEAAKEYNVVIERGD